ncbi:L,D-transpeptidase family protein [Streptomyces sp. E11-3]|uniref:L,D-transpeptidase family protein n=1 Tax=Streptomyces sp. E11-3 TaxID=3110112 RepID=UPI00398105F9
MRRTSGMRRGSVRRRSLAAVAVVAVTAGCTAQAVDGAAGDGQDGLGGKRPPPLTSAPSPSPGGKSPDGKSPDGKSPAGSEASPGVPSKGPSKAPAQPKVLLTKGDRGERVRDLQARLRQIAWFGGPGPTGSYGGSTVTAVKGFQAKRGLTATGETDEVTWQRLLDMTRKPGFFELYAAGDQPAAKPDPRCLQGRVLCISKKSRTLTWMVDGRAMSTVDVRFGSQYTPTREGEFSVYWKSRHHHSTLYDTPMPYAMFFSGGQAVHYSSDFAARGYSGTSHGCVNVRNEKKIAALFAQVRTGDKVVIYW